MNYTIRCAFPPPRIARRALLYGSATNHLRCLRAANAAYAAARSAAILSLLRITGMEQNPEGLKLAAR